MFKYLLILVVLCVSLGAGCDEEYDGDYDGGAQDKEYICYAQSNKMHDDTSSGYSSICTSVTSIQECEDLGREIFAGMDQSRHERYLDIWAIIDKSKASEFNCSRLYKLHEMGGL